MARDDPQINIRMPAKLKAGIEAAASANNRSVTAEIVARLEQTMSGPKHPPNIVVRLEALPPGTPTHEISLGTFFENFSWTLRASLEALKDAPEDKDDTGRAKDGLDPPVDESSGDNAAGDRAAEIFREQLERRMERARSKAATNPDDSEK